MKRIPLLAIISMLSLSSLTFAEIGKSMNEFLKSQFAKSCNFKIISSAVIGPAEKRYAKFRGSQLIDLLDQDSRYHVQIISDKNSGNILAENLAFKLTNTPEIIEVTDVLGMVVFAFEASGKMIANAPVTDFIRESITAESEGEHRQEINGYSLSLVLWKTHNQGEFLVTKSDNIRADFSLGCDYHNKGLFNQAIVEFSKVIDKEPKFFLANFLRGSAYYNTGCYDQAILDFSKAIEIKPDDAESYCMRGVAYYKKGLLTEAIADLSKCLELNPGLAGAYTYRASAYFDKKEYNKAWADVHAAQELKYPVDPDFIEKLKKTSGWMQ